MEQGKLYLCPTPIGNLKDMTERVLETLRTADLIAAEDTRNSLRLLNHFDIHTELTSYHEYNKVDKAYTLISKMKEGKNVALITDAGTPAISDPGEVLVRMCEEEGILVTSLPGPCALITALTLSGLPTRRFCFEGFLPGREGKQRRKKILKDLTRETRTIILYEAPHHLKATLKDLLDNLGNRQIALCRELTKKFEEVLHFTLEEAVSYYEKKDPRGEYVLVIQGMEEKEQDRQEQEKWLTMSIQAHMRYYEDQGTDHKEAMKLVAKDRGIPKREVYQALIREEEQ